MTTTIKNVLVPVNFSKTSLNAMNSAIKMCQRHNATLHLLHVGNPMELYPSVGMQAPIIPISDKFIEEKQNYLDAFAEAIEKKHHINCEQYLEYDGLIRSICLHTQNLNIDMVVMGIHARGVSSAYFMDSLAYKIIKHVACPVLTIPKNRRINSFENVLIPVRTGVSIQEKMMISDTIIKKNRSFVHFVGSLMRKDVFSVDAVTNTVRGLKSQLSGKNIASSYQVHLSENIAVDVAEAGKEIEADLIVISASTKRNLVEFINGNFTQKMINNTYAAVLCVKSAIAFNKSPAIYNSLNPYSNSAL